MQFNNGYHSGAADLYGSSPMDRSFYVDNPDAAGAATGIRDFGAKAPIGQLDSEFGLTVKDVGMSVPMGISAPNVQGIYSKIRAGLSKIEIGFPAAGSGNRQAQSPGMYGKDMRQAIKELGIANEVEFNTHAAYNVMGMTGSLEQAGDLIKFDMNRARMGQHEIERAVDFAADVPGGGSVVIHTGEFLRPLTDIYVPDEEGNLARGSDGRTMWKQRLTEDKDATFYLIDDRTGQAMRTVEKDRLVAYPHWLRSKKEGHWGMDKQGNRAFIKKDDYVDYEGLLILDAYDPVVGRVPEFDDKTREFKVDYLSFNDFEVVAKEKNDALKKRLGRSLTFQEATTQTEAYFHATLETNEGHSRGWSGQYAEDVDTNIEMLEKLNKAKDFYQKIDAKLPPEEKWKIAIKEPNMRVLDQIIPPETKDPLKYIEEQITNARTRINFARQASVSQLQQAQDTAETKRHIIDPIKYVDRYAVRHYAESALHAMDRSKDPNNPIVLTMEHIFPERFGGHPQEHKWLIKKARERFVEYLTEPEMELGVTYDGKPAMAKNKEGLLELQKQPNPYYKAGLDKEQAKKLAERHIKATIDTGHLNLWRKYFQPRPGATPEDNENEFKQWFLGQIEDFAKDNLVGNVHLVDNYGYQDDHLSPGQGNAPIKETMKILKKFGYDKAYTVEPGADASTDLSDFHGVMKTWRFLGAPIYGLGAPSKSQQTWGKVQYSYFGQNQPPYFIFGSYSPSNDWTLWSQSPME
ncbi:sugar phosphate isomerase/epimerase [Candidatus Woesearchaeota archaeon]|nr:sugar phosphate isomerase/epimerase [Candidatus Woesearchaeota archaeon]